MMFSRLPSFIAFVFLFAFSCDKSRPVAESPDASFPQHDTLIRQYLLLPDSLLKAALFDSALYHYEIAEKKYLDANEKDGYLKAVNGAAWSEISAGEYPEAIDKLNNLAFKLSDINSLAEISRYYYNKATAFKYTGLPDSSENYYRLAIEGYEQYPLLYKIKRAECYLGLGGIYCFSLRDFGNAQIYFEKALSEIHSLDNSKENLDIKFRCYYNLSVNNRWRNNYDKAEYYAKGVLGIASQIDNPNYLRYAHNMLASIYESRGDFSQSIQHFEQVIRNILLVSKDDYKYLVQSHVNLGITYGKDSLHREAISALEKALELERKYDLKLTHDKAEIFAYLGRNYHKINAEEIALTYFKRAKSLMDGDSGKHLAKSPTVFYELADYYLERREYDIAIQYYLQSLNHLKKSDDSGVQGYTDLVSTTHLHLNGLARAYKLKGLNETPMDTASIKLALRNFILADSLLQLHRKNDLLESDELYLNNNSQEYYREALSCVRLLFNTEKTDKALLDDALRLIEQNKGGILSKSLKKVGYLKHIGVPDSVIQRRRDLKQQIAYWQAQEKTADSVNKKGAQKRLLSLIQNEELLNFRIEDEYKTQLDFETKTHNLGVDSLQQIAKKDSCLIISYYVGKDYITSLAVGPTRSFLYFVPMDSGLLQSLNIYSQMVSTGNPVSKIDFQKFKASSYHLYEQLLKPALTKNSKIARLLIIPDQILATIPYESLITQLPDDSTADVNYKTLEYLFKHYEIGYHYSLGLMAGHESDNLLGKKLKFSGWGYENLETPDHAPLPSLFYARSELDEVSQHFDTDIFFNGKATETNFKENAARYDVLHLCLHGSFSSENGLACLYFNKDNKNDGLMYPYELYNLNLNAQLAVLSACETGVGSIEPGEGIFSIARGFFYSGCPSLVINMWKVKDKSGLEIQSQFYENLSNGKTISQSLLQAKSGYIKKADQYSAHPSFWASPILVGSNNRLVNENSTTGYVKVFAVISIIVVLSAAVIFIAVFTRRYNTKSDIIPR